MTPEEFLERYYERRHVVIRRGQSDHFSELLTLADLDAVLTGQVLAESDIQLVRSGSRAHTDSFTTARGDVDPIRVMQLFRSGYSLIFLSLNRRRPELQALCRALENVFSCDLQTNVYLSPAGSQGVRAHFDTHDVLILQCAGTKQWQVYASPIMLPLTSQAFRRKDFDPGPVLDRFELGPGDVAYLPRGTVHDAICGEQPSLHVTAGLLTTRWVDLLQEALLTSALEDPELRRALPPGYAQDPALRQAMIEHCRTLFTKAARGGGAARVVEDFASGFRSSRHPEAAGQLLQEFSVKPVEFGTLAALRPSLLWSIATPAAAPDGQAVIIFRVHDTELSFPAVIEPTLRDALTRPHFRIGELTGGLDSAGQLVLVRQLITEGVLRVLEDPPAHS